MSEDRTKAAATPPPRRKKAEAEPAPHPPRPAKEPVDFDALYKKITTRFRRTLARLAE